jgi:outer membrane protein W
MRRFLLALSAWALVCGFIATPSASAQQQTLSLFVGGFTPRTLDARTSGDALVADSFDVPFDLSTFNSNSGIDVSKFNGATVGGEWLFPINRNFEGGLGLAYYQKTVRTSYTQYVNPDGSEITQSLKLRIVPFTATFRYIPFGTNEPIQPYIGVGVGVFAWRYSETGQFVDPTDLSIFPENNVGSGGAVGPVILGGVRIPIGPLSAGFELRHQSASGNLPSTADFVGTKIDLGGMNYLFVLGIRF